MADDSSSAFDESKVEPIGKGAEPLGGEGAELRKPPGWGQTIAEEVGRIGAYGAGAAEGAEIGAGIGSVVPGLGTAIGAGVGAIGGAAVAGTGADALIAKINEKLNGTPVDVSPRALATNLGINAGGAVLGGVLGGAAERMVTEPITSVVEGASKEASEETLLGPRGIAAATGVSPEETEASLHAQGPVTPEGVQLPPPELIQRRKGLADAAFGPSHKIQEAIGTKFDTHFDPHMDTDVDVGDLRSQPQEIRDWAAKPENNYTLSQPINKLLTKVDKVGADAGNTWPLVAKFVGQDPKDFAKLPLAEQQSWLKAAVGGLKRGQLGGLSQEEGQKLLVGAGEEAPSTVAKVRELLGLRHEASALMGSEASAVNRSAANDIVESIDKHLEGSGIPGAQDLRAEYATHKASFGRDFYRNIAKAQDPIDAAPHIFNNKDIAAPLYNSGDATQQAYLRKLFGDWANESGSQGKTVVDWGQQRDFLKAAFAGTKLAKETPWRKMPSSLEYASKYLQSTPDAAKQISAIARQDIETQAAEAAKAAGQGALKAGTLATGGKGYAGRMMESIKRRYPIYLAVAAGGAASGGHVSPFMAGMAALGTLDLSREGLTRALSWSLQKSPKLAESFVDAVGNPNSMVSRQVIGKAIAGSLVSHEAEKVTGYGDLEKQPEPADINDVAKSAAIKSKEGGVRAVEPGESHDDAVRRTGMKGAVHGFNDQNGEFMDRKTAQAQIKGLGGKDEPPHSDQIALGPRESEPEPVSLGSSPVRQLVSGWVNANPKGPVLRDLDDAAREYRRGNIPAMDPQKWLQKGLTPQEIANGYKLSGMSRMDAALSQLSVPQLTDAWKIAQKTHDEADGNRIKNVLAKQLKDGAWGGLKPEEKKRVAQAMRDIYAPDKSLNEA